MSDSNNEARAEPSRTVAHKPGEARVPTGARLPPWARQIPIDLVALFAIALFVIPLHLHYVQHGMVFDDPSWLFHFGRRALHGDVPYRDFVFQVGPLPIYVDAGFQGVFGSTYVASLYAAMFTTILRVLVVWMIVRRIASWQAAALVCVFCSLDTTFHFQHHWATQYSSLFMLLCGLFILLASRTDGRRALVYLGLAGASAALVVTARQSSAILIAVVLLTGTVILLVRKQLTRPRIIALWAGYAVALVCVMLLLAVAGALGPAIQQMFIDAPAKKGVHGITSVLDAVSGGALVAGGDFTWWRGLLTFLGMPIAIVVVAVYLARRAEPVDAGTVAMMVMPVVLLLGLGARYLSLSFLTDVPRTFLSTLAAFAVLSPERLRRWFGLEPLVALGLAGVALASDWALEMSFPGRGWGDAPSLFAGTMLVSLASSRIPTRIKTATCAAFAVMGVLHFGLLVRVRTNPFAHGDAADGSLRDNKHRVDHPMLRGMKVNAFRKATLTWLTSQVRPGSTCFIYGNMPVLYSLLECSNPTALDTTAGDFFTGADGAAASAALFAHPPDFIIAHESAWMNPPISEERGTTLGDYGDSLNPAASRAMHMGMRAIIDRYESLGTIGEAIGAELAEKAALQRDRIGTVRVYRRAR